MFITTNDSLSDLLLTLEWQKNGIHHTDSYFADEANFYRDFFPPVIHDRILNKTTGEHLEWTFEPGELVPAHSEKQVHRIKPWQIDLNRIPDDPPGLRNGRYYPKGMISGISGIFKQNTFPFRVKEIDSDHVIGDFNHPLSGIPLTLSIDIMDIRGKNRERGGLAGDWVERATTGPGIQARQNGEATDFFSGSPFERTDMEKDVHFYKKDRLVSHVDDTARKNLAGLYARYLKPGTRILDLMASWKSHLPEDLSFESVYGLGMNETELAVNPRLTGYTVHDMNENPVIPYDDCFFDAVICSLSVEYLTRPFEVFPEIARILKPGGRCIISFSNRWFPTKAIRIWPELHEFERMALITEYFLESGRFEGLSTVSLRGFPRPYTDDYFPGLKLSDPLYVVTGTRGT